MITVRFTVFGGVSARTGDRVTEFGPTRLGALLGVLLVDAGRVVSADDLVERVLGDAPPPRARAMMQTWLTRLRHSLPGLVERDGSRLPGAGRSAGDRPAPVPAPRAHRPHHRGARPRKRASPVHTGHTVGPAATRGLRGRAARRPARPRRRPAGPGRALGARTRVAGPRGGTPAGRTDRGPADRGVARQRTRRGGVAALRDRARPTGRRAGRRTVPAPRDPAPPAADRVGTAAAARPRPSRSPAGHWSSRSSTGNRTASW